MADNLNKQIVKGVSWTFVETFSMYFVRFAIGIILARLLLPQEFGVIGMAAIFIAVSEVFISAGFGQAYIYKENVTDKDANTVFYLNLAISLLIYSVVFLLAPQIAHFFNTPQLKDVIRVLFIVVIIDAFSIIQYSIIRKNFLFKKKALARLIASILSGIVGIVMAYIGFGVWSLVTQQICSHLFICIILYLLSNWRPSLSFSTQFAKQNFGYSIWLLFSDTMNALMNNFYRLAIGKAYTATSLGLYDTGERFKTMISDSFISIFTQVAFPSFTKVKNQPSELLGLCKRYVKFSTLAIFPVLITMMVISKPFVLLLLTEKWIGVVPYIRILCVVGLIVPYHVFLFPLLEATGYTKLVFGASITRAILRIINVVIAVLLGNVLWILYGEIAVLTIMVVLYSLISKKRLHFNYLSVVLPTSKTIAISLVTIIFGETALHFIDMLGFNAIFIFIIPIIIMITTYIALNVLFQKDVLMNIVEFIKKKQ